MELRMVETHSRNSAQSTLSVFTLSPMLACCHEAAAALLMRRGFDIIWTERLGGDCGRQESQLLVAVDLCPWPCDRIPGSDNGRLTRVAEVEEYLRTRHLGEAVGTSGLVDVTANTSEAWQAIDELLPARKSSIQVSVAKREAAFATPFPVVHSFQGHRNNAKVEVVRHEGHLRVCKVFRPGREQYLANELNGLRLSNQVPEIPPALDSGRNWVVMPWFESARPLPELRNRFGFVPLPLARKAFQILKRVHERGYLHLDFHPDHVLVLKNGDVRLIDFDRLVRMKEALSFEQSPAVAGYDDWLDEDGPNGDPPSYQGRWERLTGVSFERLMGTTTRSAPCSRLASICRHTVHDFLQRPKVRRLTYAIRGDLCIS